MTTTSHLAASGPGWSVREVVCTAGPGDRPFEERHDAMCIAAVTAGSFQYRTREGRALLAPGALLLGNAGHCFECGHEHASGDCCLAFHFTPAFMEAIVADIPGVRTLSFPAAHLPPLPRTVPLLAAAEAAARSGDPEMLEELAVAIAGTVVSAFASGGGRAAAPSRSDERRVTKALRRIERDAGTRLPLSRLADAAGMSPYHFLRTFRRVVGLSPHQYVLRTRLHRAALRLRDGADPVAAIAFEAGFNDLSTFNRRFRRATGVSPRTYRAARGY